MEAKDTVIDMNLYKSDGFSRGDLVVIQSEISFKAGQIQGLSDAVQPGIEAIAKSITDGIEIGRREVVEWINASLADTPTGDFYCFIRRSSWQAKLKEWGL